MSVERHFPEAARRRIAEAVRRAEGRSTGQVVPVVVERSEPYDESRWMGALLGAVLVTAVVELLLPEPTVAEVLAVQAAGGLLGWFVGRLAPVERFLAGRRHQEAAVRARAERAFLEKGLHRTREGTGVLVFASLREHRAVVLGDHGIHARMGEEGWRQAVDALVEGLRRGDPGGGFETAIDQVGGRLAEHFPRGDGPAPPNELPDDLRTGR